MLRDYQESVVTAAMAFIRYRSGHGYVTAPGGSGKSHMIAAVGERAVTEFGDVLVLARSEKLLTQNRAKFSDDVQESIGVYCAGLGLKELGKPITIASAQSLAGAEADLSRVRLVLVDECDEISDDEESQYQRIFAACHPEHRIVGFTATPFRTGSGKITWGEEIINIPLKAIMDAGHLTPPTNKVGTVLDLSNVRVALGEYVQSQLDELYADPTLLAKSVEKIRQYSAERSHCLIFTQSVAHADLLASAMEFNGMPCVVVTGDTDKDELAWIIQDFEEGRCKYLINVMLLTRGYDMPAVDMIAVLRATKSKRLWEQILYRGTRLHPAKRDFLVLDMGNNFITHGPLGSPNIDSGRGASRAASGKICPVCEDFTPPLARSCPACGYQFPEPEIRTVSHAARADNTSATIYDPQGEPVIQKYAVENVLYKIHKNRAKGTTSIMVSYYCGYGKYGNIAEWISPWSKSEWAQNNAWKFFKERGVDLAPPISAYSEDDLLWHCDSLKKPIEITVDHSAEFPRVKHYRWEEVLRPTPPQPELDDEIIW